MAICGGLGFRNVPTIKEKVNEWIVKVSIFLKLYFIVRVTENRQMFYSVVTHYYVESTEILCLSAIIFGLVQFLQSNSLNILFTQQKDGRNAIK